mmetsp:Transcript_8022/g.22411  ORF Transcript_8022/g.22411 Transcript_8022/m.22411 type:complete len:84 (-) Transcript_8022:715-966(-)
MPAWSGGGRGAAGTPGGGIHKKRWTPSDRTTPTGPTISRLGMGGGEELRRRNSIRFPREGRSHDLFIDRMFLSAFMHSPSINL